MQVENSGLLYSKIPKFAAPIEDIWSFALTYDGYEACVGFEACADTARIVTRTYKSQGYLLNLDLHHLRSSLFFEQRRYRHMGQIPGEPAQAYLNLILHAIRAGSVGADSVPATTPFHVPAAEVLSNGVFAAEFSSNAAASDSHTELVIDKALSFAASAHRGTHRKGTDEVPYISHPVAVASSLREVDAPREIIVAGLLHDTVEDTCVSLEDIEKAFGSEVRSLVDNVSEADKSDSWLKRKQHTIEYMRTAPLEVKVLSCADKLHNANSIITDLRHFGSGVWARFNRGRDDQLWYYSSLVDSLLYGIGNEQNILFQRYAKAVEELVSLA